MGELLKDIEDEVLNDEGKEMGSLNHSLAQGQILTLLSKDKRFRVIPELSLDTGQIDLSQFGLEAKKELKPDICVYPNTLRGKKPDILRMLEMPLLTIEVISSSQSIDEMVAKFDAYFALGVKSCWLVMPLLKSIAVYSQPNQARVFDQNDTEVIDPVMDIRLPIQEFFAEIFAW